MIWLITGANLTSLKMGKSIQSTADRRSGFVLAVGDQEQLQLQLLAVQRSIAARHKTGFSCLGAPNSYGLGFSFLPGPRHGCFNSAVQLATSVMDFGACCGDVIRMRRWPSAVTS